MRGTTATRMMVVTLALGTVVLGACGDDDDGPTAAPTTAASAASATTAAVRTVAAADFRAAVAGTAGITLFDVRTPDEFAAGHLEGATVLDFTATDFADRLAALDPTAPYAIYCHSGNRSGQAAAVMAQMGFTDVVNLDGGITAWQAAGFPIVT